MSTRPQLFALTATVLLVPLFGTAEKVTRSHPAAPASESIQAKRPGGLKLRNDTSGGVRVEIGVSFSGDCTRDVKVTARLSVPAGRAWEIRSSQPICVRQEKLETDGQRRLQGWQKKTTTTDSLQEVIL